MAQPLISLSWKDHPSDIVTLCRNFLDYSYLVDCIISAEGQYLEAHRLILSACSPYFQMLFNKQRDRHPLVVLLGPSFQTLQAVMDFVYRGEAQIPEEKLEAFLELARTLQIRGLTALKRNDGNNRLCGSADRNVFGHPSEENRDNCEGQDSSSKHEDTTNRDPSENVQSISVVAPPPQEQQILSECGLLRGLLSKKGLCGSADRNVPARPTAENRNNCEGQDLSSNRRNSPEHCLEQHLNHSNGCSDAQMGSTVHFENSWDPLENLQSFVLLQQQQNLIVPDRCEATLQTGIAVKHELLSSECLEGNQKLSNAVKMGKSMPEIFDSEMDTEIVPPNDQQNLSQNAGAVELPAANGAGGQHEEQERERQSLGANNMSCLYCDKTFKDSSHLRRHVRTHTGERTFKCNTCNVSFHQKVHLDRHKKRAHANERSFVCDVCGETCKNSETLAYHKLIHPSSTHVDDGSFKCAECNISFSQFSRLSAHTWAAHYKAPT